MFRLKCLFQSRNSISITKTAQKAQIHDLILAALDIDHCRSLSLKMIARTVLTRMLVALYICMIVTIISRADMARLSRHVVRLDFTFKIFHKYLSYMLLLRAEILQRSCLATCSRAAKAIFE